MRGCAATIGKVPSQRVRGSAYVTTAAAVALVDRALQRAMECVELVCGQGRVSTDEDGWMAVSRAERNRRCQRFGGLDASTDVHRWLKRRHEFHDHPACSLLDGEQRRRT